VTPEVRDALDSACTVATGERGRHRSRGAVRAIVYAVVESLPGEMTLAELADEICIASAQAVD
jgi:hypothetical protein